MGQIRTRIEPESVGAWVKIPGLDPREPHALNFLSIEELDKLAERVAEAKAKAVRKARTLAAVNPGDMVELMHATSGVPAGSVGIIVQRSAATGSGYRNLDTIPVAFAKHGFAWVQRSYLVKLNPVSTR